MRFHTVCVLYVLIVLGGCSQTLSQISNEHGFQRLQAPQKNLEPGTLITYEESGESFAVITPVCWRHQAFPGMPPARSVSRAEQDLMGEFGDWHDLAPTYLENIQEKFPQVDDIELRLGNASVSQYSDTELYKGLSTRSEHCQDAVVAREGNGETVYTILKVLNADVTYKITGTERNRLVGKLPQKTLERLKTELGGSSVSTFEQTIKGANLQVAFQSDIIGVAGTTTSSADARSESSMDVNSMNSTENQSVSSPEAEAMSTQEVNSLPSTERAAMEFPRASRITKAQRQSMVKKIAVLSKGRSDADQLQRK